MVSFNPYEVDAPPENGLGEKEKADGENYQEANAFQAPSKPTVILVDSNEIPESEGPVNVKQNPAPASEALSYDVNNWKAVTIRDTMTRRGRGVFAIRDFEKGHNIIVEEPVITCTHRTPINRNRTVAEEWCALSPVVQLSLRASFHKLRLVPIGQDTLSWFWRKWLERFVLEYAFCNPQKSLAHIYVLGSHMNHACSRCANAQQWTDSSYPHHINVMLVKPLKAGDEVFINYNRRQGPSFGCALCSPPGWMDQFDALTSSISQWFSRFRTNKVAVSETTNDPCESQESTQKTEVTSQ